MRAKRRYITVEIVASKTSFSKADIETSILDSVKRLHGVFGIAAVSSFTVKYWNSVTCISLMRVYFGPHKLITTALPFVSSIAREPVTINTLFIGATLKRCYLNIQKHQFGKLEKLWSNLTTKEEKKRFKSCFLDSNIIKHLKGTPR